MIVIKNNIIPFKGYSAMTLWPFVFVRKGTQINEVIMRHETIHAYQQRELLVLGFLLWYGIEWLVRLLKYRSTRKAYKMISFEKEAYANERKADYLNNRRLYAWLKYTKKQ